MNSTMTRSLIAVVVFMCAAMAYGQSAQQDPITIEELYLESHTSIETISAQLRSDSLELQLLALMALEDQVSRGALDPNSDEYVIALATAATRGVTNFSGQPYDLPNGYRPQVRSLAAELLGLSDENPSARIALFKLLDSDPEPIVRARAALALASIGKDPQNAVSFNIGKALHHEALTGRDEGFIFSSLLAIERLGEEVGMLTMHPMVRESAMSIALGGFNRLLREKAVHVLARM
jgi:hypothetical protein